MSSMLVAAILASRRGRFYDSKTAEFQSDSSTVGEDPIIFSKQQAMCDESQLDAAKKRLDVRLHGPQPTSQTNSCGSCGYDLNLNSSSRNTSTIGSKYGKSIKKGIISFFTIDESRFNQVEEFSCVPYFVYKHSWGLFGRRTKLLCRKCGNLIGLASDQNSDSSIHLITDGSDSPSSSEVSSKRKYDIRIRSLQPSSTGFGTPLVS